MQTDIESENLLVAKKLESEDFSSQRFLDGLDENVEWFAAGPPSVLPWAGIFRGRTEVAEWVKTLRANLNYQKWNSHTWLVKNDTVIELVHAGGIARATGKSYQSDIVRVWTVKNGKAVRVQSFYDTAAYAIALGTLAPTKRVDPPSGT